MLTWPHEDSDWGGHLADIYPVFAQIGVAISKRQPLLSVCRSLEHATTVKRRLLEGGASADHLAFALADSNDSWARDYGPLTTLSDANAQLNDFVFNGWGGKFPAGYDRAVSRRLHEQRVFAGTVMHMRDLVLEGGAVETDGTGTLLATRTSILADSRNPGHSQQQIERLLRGWLGFERFMWLDHGHITGDDTDGHVDTLARFADPGSILHATAPQGDQDHLELVAMREQLQTLRTPGGQPYRLLPLPFPGVHTDANGRRLPASYTNFLIINGAVLLPVYGAIEDRAAEAVMRQAFPGREIVPVDCRRIIEQNGSLHCLTMQFPAGVRLRDTLEFVGA
jgi:agmatine/peptidylarginine deiminase